MKKLTNYILIILGFVLFISFIWLKFIRERIPRVIPFNLTLFGFLILVGICCMFIYIIISLLFNYQAKSKILSLIISHVYKPLIALDEAIKTNYLIKPYYERILVHLITITKDIDYFKVYLIFDIIPRVILVSALLIDTFYFHCLFLFYKIIIISLILVTARYIKYSLKYAKEHYILQLESMIHYIVSNYEDPDDELAGICLTNLSVKRFIEIQINAIVYEDKEYTYTPVSSNIYRSNFRKQYNLPSADIRRLTTIEIDLMHVDFYRIMKIVISLGIHLEEYAVQTDYNTFKRRKSIIFILYLICWSYILFVSFHTLPPNTFSFLLNLFPYDTFNILSTWISDKFINHISSFDFVNFIRDIVDKEEPFSGNEICIPSNDNDIT